ncbi:MAG: aminoglycoside phosphotransferase family protein [Dermatophilaceae bacterium]|nr:aminoglycoside phosphotransferase family protein [Dermatophilaceae bacterium]
MPFPADHPATLDPVLAEWAGGIDEAAPGAVPGQVLRHLPGRRIAVLTELGGRVVVVKVFASPRARGNARRLLALAGTPVAGIVPAVVGCDPSGHVLAVSYHDGTIADHLPDNAYAGDFAAVGRALRSLHDSGADLDRQWSRDEEVAQLVRRQVPATAGLVHHLDESTQWLRGAPVVPSHRDFHPRQVVVTPEGGIALIDLDDAAMAPRGLDVGNMVGHLVRERLMGRRPAAVVEAATAAFLGGYGHSDDLDAATLQAWTTLSLVRLAALAETRHQDPAQHDALVRHVHGLPSMDGAGFSGP